MSKVATPPPAGKPHLGVTPYADTAFVSLDKARQQHVPRIHQALAGILRRSAWPEMHRLLTIDVERPGGLTTITCGDRCLIPTWQERRLQDYLSFFADGDQIDVEATFRVDDSNNNEIHIVRAVQDQTSWPFPLSDGPRAFLEDCVRDQLSLEAMREDV